MNYLIMPDVTNPGNPVNEASKKPINTRSTFDLSYSFFDTHRFGEYHPHFVFDGVPDDKNIQMNSAHDLRSYSLQAPLMQDISMKKDYFAVPLSAILPLNWEKWYKAPNIGDDVADNVGPVAPQFWSHVSSTGRALITQFASMLSSASTEDPKYLQAYFRLMIWLEYFYSSGSLLKTLGISGNQLFDAQARSSTKLQHINFDEFFDYCMSELISNGFVGFTLDIDSTSYPVRMNDALFEDEYSAYLRNSISLHAALSLMRDNLNFSISAVWMGSSSADSYEVLQNLWDHWTNFVLTSDDSTINLSRIFAYQIACSHFYSSDNIDYIYSAELYRQLIDWCIHPLATGSSTSYLAPRFVYNGVSCLYDSLSGFNFISVLRSCVGTSITGFFSCSALEFLTIGSSESNESKASGFRGYFSNILAFRRSLRYQDYFTGSRSTPLAVGDSNVAVSNSQVNVIDMASGIQKTRLWNAVSRAGSKIRKYMREIMGTEIPMDYHDPYFLAHTSDNVFGSEVENTGAAQQSEANSVTAVLRSNGARYAFNFDVDIPCVILGITYYDLPRVYTYATEKQNYAANRFDLFNPFLQFAGDQVVSRNELGIWPSNAAFSYQLRDMQYKQRYNQAAGGFVDNLPGYMFTADDRRFWNFLTPAINEEFIRSLPSELDEFYISLTGYSLGSYFHFIVKNVNSCKASRPMAYAPSIL